MRNLADMTPEEIMAELGAAGTWGPVDEHTVPSGIVDRQRDALIRLRELLEGVVAQDHQRVAKAREQLAKLKFGGGS